MTGTREGGLKAREKHLAKDPDYYTKIGTLGGKASTGGGFAAMTPAKRIAAGRKGGHISRRGPAKTTKTPKEVKQHG